MPRWDVALGILAAVLYAAAYGLQAGYLTPSMVNGLTSGAMAFLGVLATIAALGAYAWEQESRGKRFGRSDD